MSLLDTASLVITPNGTKASTLYSVVPSSGAGDMTVTRATTATRVNSAGLIESVASNVPRLDYSNGTCPSILVEPQRTNLLTYSSDFTNGWYAYLGSITATANYGIAPDGTNTSTRILFTSNNQIWAKAISGLTGLNGTFSLYIKGVAGQTISIAYGGNDNTVTLQSGWNRYSVTGVGTIDFVFINTFSSTATNIEVWGGQVELATYATSYIPTTSASVTRNADVINKTGISSLIGQTEGTLFCEINTQISPANNWFQILDGTANNWIFIGLDANKLRGYIRLGATTVFSDTSFTLTSGVSAKIALAYKSGDIALYINGNQIATSSNSFTASSSIDRVIFGDLNNAPNDSAKYKQATLWKTRLTNTQLAQLTTI